MNQSFPEVKFYMNHLNWSIFIGGGGVVKNFGGTNFQKVPKIIIFVILFWTGG